MIKYARTYCCRKCMYREVFPKGGIGAEIGVLYGVNALDLMYEAKPRYIHLIDVWRKDEIYLSAKRRLSRYPNAFLHRMYCQDACKLFPDRYFDWIYVDANHRRAIQDFEIFLPKIKLGGILAGHDFSRPLCAASMKINYPSMKINYHQNVKDAVHLALNRPCSLICFTEEDQRSFSLRVINN